MTQPSNSAFFVRTVEWVRGHGGKWLVNDIEHIYYSLNAPPKGGPALKSLPRVGIAAPPVVQKQQPYRPRRVRPVLTPRLRGEGVWHAAGPAVRGGPPVLVTTFRADPIYPRLTAGVAWFDRSRTRVALYPGRYEPPSASPRGPMEIPQSKRSRLVGAFNSGFKLEDGGSGFVANGHVYHSLVPGEATLLGYSSGRVDVRAWQGGALPGPRVTFARQNLPLIIQNRKLNPNLSDGPAWGATLGNAIRVWRSGVGVDRRGDLLYAAANNQTVTSLAEILRHAGAVRAMELDINAYWVSLITYRHWGALDPANLLPDMNRPATRYLSPDDRDFFAVYRMGHR
jgi:Phosphodiester glycosidase